MSRKGIVAEYERKSSVTNEGLMVRLNSSYIILIIKHVITKWKIGTVSNFTF